jgi:DNA polymerase III subunit delta'
VTWETVGQAKALRLLKAALDNPAHAYLLAGPAGSGKAHLAREFAQALFCGETEFERPCKNCPTCKRVKSRNHPDLHYLEPQGKVGYKEEETEGIPGEAAVSPFEAPYKVFILDRAESLNRWAANALLKVLEEPPLTVVCLLLTSQPEAVLETVSSRCRLVQLGALSERDIARTLVDRGLSERSAEELAGLSNGRLGWALQAAQDSSMADRRRQAIAAVVEVARAGLPERFTWARRAAERFAENHDTLYEELDLWAAVWRDVLRLAAGRTHAPISEEVSEAVSDLAERVHLSAAVETLKAIISAKEALEANVNARLALENMVLALPGKAYSKGEAAALAPR